MPTITVENLPQGMDAEKVKVIVARYEKNQINYQKLGKARRDAVNTLIEKHPSEYSTLLAAAKKKHGVVTS